MLGFRGGPEIQEVVNFLVDDASTDGTQQVYTKFLKRYPIFVMRRENRVYKLANFVLALGYVLNMLKDPEAVIVELDGDDTLHNPDVLKHLNEVYQDPDVWATYGSLSYSQRDIVRERSYQIMDGYDFQKGEWLFLAPRTCRAFLYANLRLKYLTNPETKRFYERANDQALFRQIANLAGAIHCKFQNKFLYRATVRPRIKEEEIPPTYADYCLRLIQSQPWPFTPQSKESLLQGFYDWKERKDFLWE